MRKLLDTTFPGFLLYLGTPSSQLSLKKYLPWQAFDFRLHFHKHARERFFQTLHEILIGCQLSSSALQPTSQSLVPCRLAKQFHTVSCHRLRLGRTNSFTFVSHGGVSHMLGPRPGFYIRAFGIFIYLNTYFVAAPLNLCFGQFFTANPSTLHLFAHFHCKLIRLCHTFYGQPFCRSSVDLWVAYFWARARANPNALIDCSKWHTELCSGWAYLLEQLPNNQIQSKDSELSQLFCPLSRPVAGRGGDH